MGNEEIWKDPRTWITIVSTGFGILGWVVAVLSFRWNRAESRRKALTEVLEPLASMAQHLLSANLDRRRCETLDFSFPPGSDRPPEAAEQIRECCDRYNQSMKEASENSQLAQSGFASRCFRFPDRISRLIDRTVGNLTESGRLINSGLFDRADLELASFRDNYAQILRDARGWRLMDPLEGLRKRFKRDEPRPKEKDELGLSEMDVEAIMELVYKRATSQRQNIFAVHPPKKLLDHPELLTSDKIIDELKDSVFNVVFQDGTARLMTLAELAFFTFNLILLKQRMIEVEQMMKAVPGSGPRSVEVKETISLNEMMRPAMVRLLLDKIAFSELPSDGDPLKNAG